MSVEYRVGSRILLASVLSFESVAEPAIVSSESAGLALTNFSRNLIARDERVAALFASAAAAAAAEEDEEP